jgi:hypothetical protein
VNEGFLLGLATTFNPATDNITYVPKNTRYNYYVNNFFLDVQQQLAKNIVFDIAYVGNPGVHLQGLLNANQEKPALGFARPYANWPSDVTAGENSSKANYNGLQARHEQRVVAGLTLLNSFTWSHALDNASASPKGNPPSPQKTRTTSTRTMDSRTTPAD